MNPTPETKQEAKHSPLPCPFCGSPAERSGRSTPYTPKAECSNEECPMFSAAMPVDEWNKRATHLLFSEMRDALDRLIADIDQGRMLTANRTAKARTILAKAKEAEQAP